MYFLSSNALLRRWVRTTFALGGGLGPSLRLAWHVLRSEGPGGIVWRLENAFNITKGRVDPWQRLALVPPKRPPYPIAVGGCLAPHGEECRGTRFSGCRVFA